MRSILQQLKLDNRIRIGYGAAFFLLLLSYMLTWYAYKQLITQSKWILSTNTTIGNLESLLSELKDAETGVRGYVITKDPVFLEPYYNSIRGVDTTYRILTKEITKSPLQEARLTAVKSMIDEKYKIMSIYIKYDPTDNSVSKDSVIDLLYKGKYLMDSLRLRIGLMKISEQKLLYERNDGLKGHYAAMNTIIVTSLVLAFLFALFGFITYSHENIGRKKAESQLRKRIHELDLANKELVEMRRAEQFAATGRIARTIAHEVRNPLTNIDLAASQIRSEMQAADDNSDMLFEMIGRNSKRINQLITELLNATRFADLAYEKIPVSTLLDETLEFAKDRIALDHVTILKKYKTVKEISVDPGKIKIALLNIVVNAIEAMPPGNKILKINTREENDKCVIEIIDNGVGMDETMLNKLFEPYFTTKTKGNGLGLTNAHNIILNHRGTVNVESVLGQGTTFIIKFNLAN